MQFIIGIVVVIVIVCFLASLISEIFPILLFAIFIAGAVVFIYKKYNRNKEIQAQAIEKELDAKKIEAANQKKLKYEEKKLIWQKESEAKDEKTIQEFESTLESIVEQPVFLAAPCTPIRQPATVPEIKISQIRKSVDINTLVDFIVIDIETTGLSPRTNEIIEISAIKFVNYKPIVYMGTLIKPKIPIPAEASRVNKIHNKDVLQSPSIDQVINSFNLFIEDFNLVGHNIEFDLSFLLRSGFVQNKKVKVFDTLVLSKSLLKKRDDLSFDRDGVIKDFDVSDYKLDTLCEYFGILRSSSHRAKSDCLATGFLFRELLETKLL